ncbi:AMGO1 protein, partial [Amia calva]|nr:AMGO1 protein [Amia calva]
MQSPSRAAGDPSSSVLIQDRSPGTSAARLLLRAALLSLALLALLPLGSAALTPNYNVCICASNIVSCSKMNLTTIPSSLPTYTAVLDLSFNSISRLTADFISSEAFLYVTKLRYLDLSSNKLRQLDEFLFEPLEQLEVLLLYNNHISQIDRSAFSGLNSLHKLYLSQNQLSRFPLELVKDKTRLPKLSLLDVSSNRIKVLPIQDLKALPAWIKNGLYFHSNPIACVCELYSLLALWHIRRLSSAVDFKDDYTCTLPGPQKVSVGVFQLNGDHMNCSAVKEADEEAYLDQMLTLSCDTRHRDMVKTWVTPNNVVVTNVSTNHTNLVFNKDSLQIRLVRPEDSGVYTCFAVSTSLNETLYVTVKVHNVTMHGGNNTLNTAYTTLVGCLASVVLVLIYLYLTPCRCFCCPGSGKAKSQQEDSIHSSMLSTTPTHDVLSKAGLSRHVAFIEPSKDLQGQNGKVNPAAEDRPESSRERGQRKRSDAESISSVFSDTPIVV